MCLVLKATNSIYGDGPRTNPAATGQKFRNKFGLVHKCSTTPCKAVCLKRSMDALYSICLLCEEKILDILSPWSRLLFSINPSSWRRVKIGFLDSYFIWFKPIWSRIYHLQIFFAIVSPIWHSRDISYFYISIPAVWLFALWIQFGSDISVFIHLDHGSGLISQLDSHTVLYFSRCWFFFLYLI